MLSRADRDLVARDATLPGLALLLDAPAVQDLLHEVASGHVEAVTPRYVRYKPGTNALVAYEVRVDGRVEVLHAKALAHVSGDRHAAKLHKPGSREVVAPAFGFARLVLPELGIALAAHPNDQKVRALPAVAASASRRSLLKRVVPSRPDLWDASLEPLAYKPERRFVAALRSGDRLSAVLRLHARGVALPVHLAAPVGLTVPTRLGARPSQGACVTSWVDGVPLDRLWADGLEAGLAGEVGRTIARWHGSHDTQLPDRRFPDDRAAIEAAAGLVGALAPDLGPAARDLAARLAVLLRVPVPSVPLHGDLHAAQVLARPAGIAFVDLDEACRGAAGADLGAFLASLLAAATLSPGTLPGVDALCDAVVDGYAREAGQVPVALDAWTAAHLLRRAPEPFRTRHQDWPGATASLLRLARHWADAARWRSRTPAVPVRRIADEQLPSLAPAMTPRTVERAIGASLGQGWRYVRVCDIRVVRHKAGRRCLLEYDLAGVPPRPDHVVTVIGKLRARGADLATASLMTHLWRDGFGPGSDHGASVPQPIGVLPDLSLWLQARVEGTAATTWAFDAEATPRLQRAAASVRRLHTSGAAVPRVHGVADEIAILAPRLARLAQARPDLAARLEAVRARVATRLLALPPRTDALLHRDLHPDHLIWNGDRMYLIDFDLAARGDAGLDVGNLAAHLLELGLRITGDPSSLRSAAEAFVAGYLREAPDVAAPVVETWTTAALARLAALSVELPGRGHTTDTLVAMCEGRLGEDAPGLLEVHP
ncbi:hypothetical protein TBR22_A40460 [Luteitalea sp. TBR-22]|uniref:phosphotransferase n=1 Tax=Luteitalea sp. TBR-22 TaxID=2802971 RepID=UPI001AF82027|nr:aminoglycoside phosphotransferase family protein [Luteitalea sp. TBR-22]BCS34820.1 hypothetical protein TBR22_A40460 [Luteitalea sp. TBR-22]